jgi:hypothetical protein
MASYSCAGAISDNDHCAASPQRSSCRLAQPLGLFRPAPKRRDFAIKLPEFYVVAVSELPGLFPGVVVILALQFNRPQDMAVTVQNVRAIVGHPLAPVCPA